MSQYPSLLVSCPGAYADSGAGTGGLVCLHQGQTVTLDRMDSMGLAVYGGRLYRFVRALHMIFVYTPDGLRTVINLPEARDVHDVLVDEEFIVCVSTGENEVLWLDHGGNLVRRWQAEGTGDAWHLNSVLHRGGRLYLSAFGEFTEHRAWSGNTRNRGFVMDLDSGEKILTGLSAPHTPRFVDDDLIVCESHRQTLTIQNADGKRREIKLTGFTRGLCWDERYLYVGESADRKAEVVADFSHVTVLDRRTDQVVDQMRVPFTEIYDIVAIDPALAANMIAQPEVFALAITDERVRRLEESLRVNSEHIAQLRASLASAHRPGYLWRRLVNRLKNTVKDLRSGRISH
jgi:hypothetical protein